MNSTYRTSDIVLASYLKLKNHRLVGIEKEGQKGIFIFEDVHEDLITQYDLGDVLVEPVSFNNMIKQLTTSVRRIV